MSGVSPSVITSQEEVDAIRQQRTEKQQQQEAAAMAMTAAQGAKTLSETQTSDPSALSAISSATTAAGAGARQ